MFFLHHKQFRIMNIVELPNKQTKNNNNGSLFDDVATPPIDYP